MRRTGPLLAAALIAAALTCGPAAAADPGDDLVTNGGFELPDTGPGWWVFESIPGWTGTDCGIEVQYSPEAHGGDQLVELDSNCPSRMYADLPTVAGWTYRVEYWHAPRPGVADNRIAASWDGTTLGVADGDGRGATVTWTEYRHVVAATASTTRLAFADLSESDPTYGGFLDDVSVRPALSLCPLGGSTHARQTGSTVPLKVALCDAHGTNISDSAVTLQAAAQVTGADGATLPTEDAGHANSPDRMFRYDEDLGGYIFNLDLDGYGSGTWTLPVTVSNGGGTYDVTFSVH